MKPAIHILGLTAVLALAGRALADNQPTIDDLLNLKPPPIDGKPVMHPPTTQPANDTKGVPIDPEVSRLLEAEKTTDLLQKALAEMNDASERLGKKLDPGDTTQRVQEGVLAKLDRVIAAAEQQQQPKGGKGSPSKGKPQDTGSSGNAQPKPGDQNSKSTTGGAAPMVTGEHAGEIRPIEEVKNEWGNLPPRVRDELKQGQDERFSPVYREMTERYYKSLAEEGK